LALLKIGFLRDGIAYGQRVGSSDVLCVGDRPEKCDCFVVRGRGAGKRDQDNLTLLFGMGQGTYPAAYFQHPDHARPGIYEITEQNGDRFLQLYPGDSLW
jgi:hypothetical protein